MNPNHFFTFFKSVPPFCPGITTNLAYRGNNDSFMRTPTNVCVHVDACDTAPEGVWDRCFTPVRSKEIEYTRLEAAGLPHGGPNQFTSDGGQFISGQATPIPQHYDNNDGMLFQGDLTFLPIICCEPFDKFNGTNGFVCALQAPRRPFFGGAFVAFRCCWQLDDIFWMIVINMPKMF